jgi:chromosome segregation ATPase
MKVSFKTPPLPLLRLGVHKMIEKRLQELRAEYGRGEQQLAQLDQRRQELHDTLLRISGAIQVLEELLQAENATERWNVLRPQELPEATQQGNGSGPLEKSNAMP